MDFMTFIIPVYNGEETISRAIDSVLIQSGVDFKLIIVDDGSIDGTKDICQEYVAKYPKQIKYIYQENNRQGAARNNAMKYVDSEYITFLDSDDALMDNYLETLYENVKSLPVDKYPQIIMTLPVRWDERTNEYTDWMDKSVFTDIFKKDGIIVDPSKESRLYETEVSVCRKCLKASFARELDFHFNEGIRWEDVVPHFFLLNNAVRCMGIVSTGFFYRIGSDTQTTATKGAERLDVVSILRELIDYSEATNNEMMYFAVMRIVVRFSIWCIRMTEGRTRRQLVRQLHKLYIYIPKKYYIALNAGAKDRYIGKDRLQYQLLMVGIRYAIFNPIFYYEYIEKLGEWIVKTVLHADGKVQ